MSIDFSQDSSRPSTTSFIGTNAVLKSKKRQKIKNIATSVPKDAYDVSHRKEEHNLSLAKIHFLQESRFVQKHIFCKNLAR